MPDLPFVPEHKLVAYADGTLPPAEMAQIESALTRSRALARRVARIKQTREIVAASYDETLTEPLSDALQRAAAGGSTVLQSPRFIWSAAALAAVLAAGLVIGRLSAPSSASPNAPRLAAATAHGTVAGPELTRLLDTAISGQERPLGAHLSATLLLSFPANNGRYCRHFHIGAGLESMSGVACRADEDWRIYVLARQPQDTAPSAAIAQARDPAEMAIDNLIEGAPLNAAQERAAISQDWRR